MAADLNAQRRLLRAMVEPDLTAQQLAEIIQSTPVGDVLRVAADFADGASSKPEGVWVSRLLVEKMAEVLRLAEAIGDAKAKANP
jgi:hypothetical protein